MCVGVGSAQSSIAQAVFGLESASVLGGALLVIRGRGKGFDLVCCF